LPIVPVDAIPSRIVDSQIPTESHAIEHSMLQDISVLVVNDDDADGRDLVAAALQNASASVTLAASAAEAVEHLSRQRFDVLVSDIAIPHEDGCSLIRT